MTLADVDSRRYIIAYELHAREDVPADFGPWDTSLEFQTGLFLPRAESDWFGRSTYPPRVLALVHGGLLIVPHPTARADSQLVRFDRLAFVESGRMLLKGWMRFVGSGLDRTLSYNRRNAPAVDAFLGHLRNCFLGKTDSVPAEVLTLGHPLDLKFRNALCDEVDAGEDIRAILFRPAERIGRSILGFKRTTQIPADLVALAGRRLLWITDSDRQGYARYGSIARYAPLHRIAGITRENAGEESTLTVAFDGPEIRWRIPLAARHASAADALIAQMRSSDRSAEAQT
jgi:hypothetical protein